jgi:hypothetical protein
MAISASILEVGSPKDDQVIAVKGLASILAAWIFTELRIPNVRIASVIAR